MNNVTYLDLLQKEIKKEMAKQETKKGTKKKGNNKETKKDDSKHLKRSKVKLSDIAYYERCIQKEVDSINTTKKELTHDIQEITFLLNDLRLNIDSKDTIDKSRKIKKLTEKLHTDNIYVHRNNLQIKLTIAIKEFKADYTALTDKEKQLIEGEYKELIKRIV